MYEEEGLFGEIEGFLTSESRKVQSDRLLESGILLFLLALRGITTRAARIDVRPSDRDAVYLSQYLLDPGLAPGLATADLVQSDRSETVIHIRPNWERIAHYYGKTLPELEALLRNQVPALVQRHRLTLMYLLGA